jgi:hypothetical protein
MGSSYALRLTLSSPATTATTTTMISADSAPFTLRAAPTLHLTSPASSAVFTAGEAVTIAWRSADFPPSPSEALRLDMVSADTGAVLAPPIALYVPLAAGNFTFPASVAWGSGALLVRATSLSTPSVSAQSPGAAGFHVLPAPRFLRLVGRISCSDLFCFAN